MVNKPHPSRVGFYCSFVSICQFGLSIGAACALSSPMNAGVAGGADEVLHGIIPRPVAKLFVMDFQVAPAAADSLGRYRTAWLARPAGPPVWPELIHMNSNWSTVPLARRSRSDVEAATESASESCHILGRSSTIRS